MRTASEMFRPLVGLLCVSALSIGVMASAEDRVSDPYVPPVGERAITVTPTGDPNVLLGCLLGPDVTITGASLTAAPTAAGTFSGALGVIGFDSGIVLGSGHISTLVGPNVGDGTGQDNGLPGDADLETLIPGYPTFDATILEFSFTCESAQDVSFQYVFSSDEYNEYVLTAYNDVFGFFLNGVNIATVPVGCSSPGIPVTIDNVNCGNPFIGVGTNCNCYRNNDLSDGGGAIDTEMDGLTQVFFATAAINAGVNTIKIAIADAGDGVWDSNVMIRCESFTCAAPPPTGACCFSDGTCVTLTYDDCQAQQGNYYGDAIPCVPNPCAQPTGACCFADGSCQVTGEAGCAANGGVYQGNNAPCDPNPCPQPPRGACCVEGAGGVGCVILTDADCAAAGGTYYGDGSDCDPDPCVVIPTEKQSWGRIKTQFR